MRRIAPPFLALALAAFLIYSITTGWNRWTANSRWQTTDDAYLRADLTPLAAKVGGYVSRVEVNDFSPVQAGQPIAEIDDRDYRTAVAQATANVAAAQAAIANNASQQVLQQSRIAAADAAVLAIAADHHRDVLEDARQRRLMRKDASSEQLSEQASANEARSAAQVAEAKAQAETERRQLDVLRTEAEQFAASLAASRAALAQAELNLSYTRIVAPADGETGERLVRPGQLVTPGTLVISVVPLPNVWAVANYKETQLARVRRGQRAVVAIDRFPGLRLTAHVDSLSPATGSQFALLPPDNATGNFTKVVQRVPVKLVFDPGQNGLPELRPGLSVEVSIDTDSEVPAREAAR